MSIWLLSIWGKWWIAVAVNSKVHVRLCGKVLMSPHVVFLPQVINVLLPVLARREVDRLLTELQEAQFHLESVPSATMEFVHSLTFLDEIQIRVRTRLHILIYMFYFLLMLYTHIHSRTRTRKIL